ncbi:MAG: hypothetical protein QM503_12680 [Bacteroidota bacterium]
MSEIYIYEKNVSGDKELEAALKQSINDWANGIPHHPFKNLGNKITVKSIWYKPAYPVRLRSQYEERSKHKDHEPFTGQTIPPRKYHKLSDFDSWDMHLKVLKKFKDSTKKYYVDGSQYVTDCHHCDAKGWMTCNTCHGHKKITCPDCRGARKVQCDSCGGLGDYQCGNCGGNGYKRKDVAQTKEVWVQNSDGNGGHYTTKTSYVPVSEACIPCGQTGRLTCKPCGGDGKVTCDRCRGRGEIQCPPCLGTGRVVCPVCDGKNQLMHHFYVERELEYTDKELCLIQSDIYKNFPEFLEEFPNYESKVVSSRRADKLEKNQLPEGHHLNSTINNFIDEANNDETDIHRMQFQQLDISCIDTWELRYQFKGKEYVMAFTGSEYQVIPGLSPIAELAFSYWRKGISAFRFYLFSRSSRLLTKSMKMDVFEIKEKVVTALSSVKEKLKQSYGLGAVIAFLLTMFFGGFVAYTYFSEVNYVFEYISFINNPENFLYPYHAWSQTLFSVFIIYLAFKSAKSTVKNFGHYVPSTIIRVITGIIFTLVFSIIFLATWALLNATGISIIITFIVWLALKILWILWWVVAIILGLIILAAQAIWGILSWLWGLIF